MKYQKIYKVLACLLAGALLAGCLGGCGNEEEKVSKDTSSVAETSSASQASSVSEESSQQPEETLKVTYPIEGNPKLTIAVVNEANVTANAEHIGVTKFGQAWQEQTGVELEVITLADKNAMSLLIASGDLPDIFLAYNAGGSYPGGAVKAIEDGIVVPISDYWEYAPDLKALVDSEESIRRAFTTSNGDFTCAPFILGDDYLCVSSGLMIRQDWLEDLDLEMPETADDLYEVLKAFKEEKNADVPFSLTAGFLNWQGCCQGVLTSPFGLPNTYWYVQDEKIHFGYAEESYRELLEWLHKLYVEGLLDPNFQTLDSATQNANFMNGKSGVTIAAIGSGMGTYLETMKDDPDFQVAGFGPLSAGDGERPMSTPYTYPVNALGAWISGQCEYPEIAAQFLNYGYTEAGIKLFNFGIEGESYTMVNNVPTYTDVIQKPEAMTRIQALAYWTRIPKNGSFTQQSDYMMQYNSAPEQVAALENWSDTDAN